MRSVEMTAKTTEEAIEKALMELGATISDVNVRVLEEGSKGLFGLFGSRPAKVLVTLNEQEEEEEDLMSLLRGKKEPEAAPAPVQPVEVKPAPVAEVETPKAEPVAEQPVEAAPVAAVVIAEEKPEEAAEAKTELPKPVERRNRTRKPRGERKPQGEEAAAEGEEKPAQEKKPRAPKQPRKEQPKAEKPEKAEKTEKPAQEKKPLPPKAPAKPMEKPNVTWVAAEEVPADSAMARARDFLAEMTRLMGVAVEIEMGHDEENNVFARMTGDTLGVLIGRRGETLDALQYLTSLRVNRDQEGYTRVTIDTENYRAKREDTLIRLANRMANRAVKTGRKVSLEPMNPYERRIIHSALQTNEAVDTHSEGEEPNRHVVITIRK